MGGVAVFIQDEKFIATRGQSNGGTQAGWDVPEIRVWLPVELG